MTGIVKNKPSGKVFDIQRYSIHDGDGIRTIVFLKGCPLRCKWCANPESQNYNDEIIVSAVKCVACGKCISICPNNALYIWHDHAVVDKGKCVLCKTCVPNCPQRAIRVSGQDYDEEELLQEILKDEIFFFSSGGGVTFSGGEPFYQYDFLVGFLDMCGMRGLHTAIETCGVVESGKFENALKYIDQVYMDLKHVNDEKHMKWTGGSNKTILENWKILAKEKSNVVVRIPVIPGFNDGDEEIADIVSFAASIGIKEAHLLPYHDLGKGKYEGLGLEYPLANAEKPTDEFMEHLRGIADKYIEKAQIGG